MNASIDFIHHVGLLPPAPLDLVASAQRYQQLGFLLTPPSRIEASTRAGTPPRYLGLSNQTIIFEHNYLEVVGLTDPAIWVTVRPEDRGAFDLDVRLARHPGLHILVWGSHDIEAARTQLLAANRAVSPIAQLQRIVSTAQGEALMKARVLFYAEPADPDAIVSVAQHDTPELVLQPRYQHHPNTAYALTEVFLCSPDPMEAASRHGARVGRPPRTQEGLHTIDLGRDCVHIGDAATLAQRGIMVDFEGSGLAGLTLLVHDLGQTAEYLSRANIGVKQVGNTLVVGPEVACGATLIFRT